MSTSHSASSSGGSRPPTATPSASTSTFAPPKQSSSRRNLKKNQACLQCRRGKMKCDAAQPHCTNCTKQWQLLLETPPEPGEAAPSVPCCDYDPVEGLVFTPESIPDPLLRVKVIQEHLAQLRGKLQEARGEAANLKRPNSSFLVSTTKRRRATTGMAGDSDSGHTSDSRRPQEGDSPFTILPPIVVDPASATTAKHQTHSPDLRFLAPSPVHGAPRVPSPGAPDLPSLEVFEHLLEVFLLNESHASRVFHVPSLKQSLTRQCSIVHPSSSSSPSTSNALLHAICAAGSRFINTGDPSTSSTTSVHLPEGFAAAHARQARKLINLALSEHQDTLYAEQDCQLSNTASGHGSPEEQLDARKRMIRRIRDKKLFQDMVQPMLVLATYLHHEGRGTEVWADVGALSRALMSLGMNHPSPEPSDSASPATLIREEEKKRAFWSTFIMDRLVSAGGWAHSMTEEDSVTNFTGCDPPLSARAFRNLRVPSNASSPITPPLPTSSEPDSYSLLIDAAVMLGRVNDFRARMRLRRRSLTPFPLLGSLQDASLATILAQDPIIRWEFNQLCAALNGGVGYWASNGVSGLSRQNGTMPRKFKYPIGVADVVGGVDVTTWQRVEERKGHPLDADLFLAHMVHHAAIVLLNFPVASFEPPDPFSDPNLFFPPPPGGDIGDSNHQSQHHQYSQYSSGGPGGGVGQDGGAGVSELSSRGGSQLTVNMSLAMQETCIVNSRSLCLGSARSIVDALSLLRATQCDITTLHPFVATCWYIAGAVLLHEHQKCVHAGDHLNKSMIAKDVQVLRLCLLKYGMRSPVGTRHEQQLSAIQEEIAALSSSNSKSASKQPESSSNVPRRGEPGEGPVTTTTVGGPRHQNIPVFPFDAAALESLPKDYDASFGGAPLPRVRLPSGSEGDWQESPA